jgi:hypothetical protein
MGKTVERTTAGSFGFSVWMDCSLAVALLQKLPVDLISRL